MYFTISRYSPPLSFRIDCAKVNMVVQLPYWICPFVSMDSRPYRAIAPKGAFCAGEDGSPEPVAWWNGKSAVLDLTSARRRFTRSRR